MSFILSDIPLPEIGGLTVRRLSYGSRLMSYIDKNRMHSALAEQLAEDTVCLVCSRETTRLLPSMAPKALKLVHLTSTGYDGVPVKELENMGISVMHLRDIYSISIAETVVYGLLLLAKRLRKNPNIHSASLFRNYNSITELYGKKVLIMGTGNIGSAIAVRLEAFGCGVWGYDPYSEEKDLYVTIYRDRDSLLEALGGFDYVLSTMPLTEDTREFCDEAFFGSMNSGAVFFNVGRQGTVSQDSFYAALKQRKIGGAVIDCVELLPFAPFSRFRRLNNTVVLPGISAGSRESNTRRAEQIAGNITEFFDNTNNKDNK